MFKVMVLGGNAGTNNVEIIDLETTSSICPKPSKLPIMLSGATALLDTNSKPIVCGGNAPTDPSSCYYFENQTWLMDAPLVNPRRFSAMTSSPFLSDSSTLIITGGYISTTVSLSSVEVRTQTGWQLFQPSLPTTLYWHCMVLVDKTTAMVIGGVQNGLIASKSFKISDDKREWSPGPALTYGRYRHACSMITKSSKSMDKSVIVVGGLSGNTLNSVEILDKNNQFWLLGPNLPTATWGMALTEDPKGGVLMVGGYATLPTDAIYRLRHAAAIWELLKKKISSPYYYVSAMLIPDKLSKNCSIF